MVDMGATQASYPGDFVIMHDWSYNPKHSAHDCMSVTRIISRVMSPASSY